MLRTWISPVTDGNVRETDAKGSGEFGASRDGGTRKHAGLDIVIEPHKPVLCPTVLEFKRNGLAYETGIGGANSAEPYRLIVLENDFVEVKILYVYPYSFIKGEVVVAGEPIGVSQDLSRRYPGITNHIHIEVWPKDTLLIDGRLNPHIFLPYMFLFGG